MRRSPERGQAVPLLAALLVVAAVVALVVAELGVAAVHGAQARTAADAAALAGAADGEAAARAVAADNGGRARVVRRRGPGRRGRRAGRAGRRGPRRRGSAAPSAPTAWPPPSSPPWPGPSRCWADRCRSWPSSTADSASRSIPVRSTSSSGVVGERPVPAGAIHASRTLRPVPPEQPGLTLDAPPEAATTPPSRPPLVPPAHHRPRSRRRRRRRRRRSDDARAAAQPPPAQREKVVARKVKRVVRRLDAVVGAEGQPDLLRVRLHRHHGRRRAAVERRPTGRHDRQDRGASSRTTAPSRPSSSSPT